MAPISGLMLPDPATPMERSRRVFLDQWDELLSLAGAVLRTPDLDNIHDLRVATRRFRAVLELYSPFIPKGSKKKLKKIVRELTRVLGGLRNVDEALAFFKPRLQNDIQLYTVLEKSLAGLRSKELGRIEKKLLAFDQTDHSRVVQKIAANMKDESIKGRSRFSLPAYFSDTSIRLYLPIHQSLPGSTLPEHRELRHSLRIAIKKWRYFLEIVAKVRGSNAQQILELLKEYQSLLGRMNDMVEFELLLGNLGLSRKHQEYLKTILQAEDAVLLDNYAALIEQKPLVYTFQACPD